jgi:hypothetical protein
VFDTHLRSISCERSEPKFHNEISQDATAEDSTDQPARAAIDERPHDICR